MKAWISVVLVAPALTVFATGCDKNGPGTNTTVEDAPVGASKPSKVDQSFSGSSLTINVDETKGHSTTLHQLVAKGQSGKAQIDALLVFETHKTPTPGPDPRCPNADPDKYPYGTDLVSLSWVQTYNDGSAFTGGVDVKLLKKTGKPIPAVCTDGARFYIDVKGPITGGAGPRFKSVIGGTWELKAWVDEDSHATGDVQATFIYQ